MNNSYINFVIYIYTGIQTWLHFHYSVYIVYDLKGKKTIKYKYMALVACKCSSKINRILSLIHLSKY